MIPIHHYYTLAEGYVEMGEQREWIHELQRIDGDEG